MVVDAPVLMQHEFLQSFLFLFLMLCPLLCNDWWLQFIRNYFAEEVVAALVADCVSGIFLAGFFLVAPRSGFPLLVGRSAGRCFVATLVVDCGSAISSLVLIVRAVLPLVVDRPRMLGIMVGLDQWYNYVGWVCW